MIIKMIAAVFLATAIGAPFLADESGNPGCRLHVMYFFGGLFAECYDDGCPNLCTEDLVLLEGSAPVCFYCPCGEKDDELPNLLCLPKIVYPEWPSSSGEFYDCETLCEGCEPTEPGDLPFLGYGPACSKCP